VPPSPESSALDDADGREVLSFQWHPGGRSPVTWPHLHLGAGAEVGRAELTSAHLPTGRVAIEEVLGLAISELGVEPLRGDERARSSDGPTTGP
jgi:hypothetical protein